MSRDACPLQQTRAGGQMPERFLLQILRSLVTHGILSSTRGVDGGYALERPVEQISLLEVIEAIDGPLNSAPAPAKGNAGRNAPPALRRAARNHRDDSPATRGHPTLGPRAAATAGLRKELGLGA